MRQNCKIFSCRDLSGEDDMIFVAAIPQRFKVNHVISWKEILKNYPSPFDHDATRHLSFDF